MLKRNAAAAIVHCLRCGPAHFRQLMFVGICRDELNRPNLAGRRRCSGRADALQRIPSPLSKDPVRLNNLATSSRYRGTMKEKIAVISGSTRGLGRALAQGLADQGYTIFGCGTKEKLVARCGAELGAPHQFSLIDVTADDAVAGWAGTIAQSHGWPDLLINNAGVINRPAPLWEVSSEEFRRVIEVNLIGCQNLIRNFVPGMAARKKGTIVNLSSGWGRSVDAGQGPYCASKWAIEGLSKALAEDLPAGMAAVALNPGIINTAMLQICWPEQAGEFQTPEEWGKKAVPLIIKIGPADNGRSMTVR